MGKDDLKYFSPFQEDGERTKGKPFSDEAKEAEEERFRELQRGLRRESQEQLGYDVFESRCPLCGEKFCLTIEDPGKPVPPKLRWLTVLVPGLRNTEALLRCVSCGRSFKTPSLLAELFVPLLLFLAILAFIAVDAALIYYLCDY